MPYKTRLTWSHGQWQQENRWESDLHTPVFIVTDNGLVPMNGLRADPLFVNGKLVEISLVPAEELSSGKTE